MYSTATAAGDLVSALARVTPAELSAGTCHLSEPAAAGAALGLPGTVGLPDLWSGMRLLGRSLLRRLAETAQQNRSRVAGSDGGA